MAFEFFFNNVEFFILIFILTLVLIFKRKNLDLQGKYPSLYIYLYKTKFGLKKMDSWSKKHPRTFLYLSYLSIFVGIFGMIGAIILMIWQLGYIIKNNLIEQAGGIVLPVQTSSTLVFTVPFWYWIISIFILIVVHEFAHGVIAQRFKVKIKSSGFAIFGSSIVGILVIGYNLYFASGSFLDVLPLLLLGVALIFIPILPGAFVEPDDKSLAKKPWWQQIAVFGAGSTSNFIFGAIFLAIFALALVPFVNNTMEVENITFASVSNQSELNDYNISSGEILAFNTITDKSEILSKMQNLSVNQSINLTIESESAGVGNYTISTYESPQALGGGMIGIAGIDYDFLSKDEYSYLGQTPIYLQTLFFYLALLNIGIGIMNLLPIAITDGGQILRTLLNRYIKNQRSASAIYAFVSLFTLALIVFTLAPDLLVSLLSLF